MHRGETFYKRSLLYIPKVEALWIEILKKHRYDLIAGHLATKKTYNTLRHKFFWLSMYKQVDAYSTSCLIYQKARVILEKQPGEPQLLRIPTKTWDIFSMDLITGLPESVTYGGTYNVILVVFDKPSKKFHYIPCRLEMTAGELAEVITREVIRLHKIPLAIISDRGSVFTSRFWPNLMYSFRIEQRLSTAFYPPTNRQTERQNSVLEQYLSSYVNYQQDNWAPLFALAEFTYNAAVDSSTGRTLFEIVYGELPRSDRPTLDEVQKYSATRGSFAEGESLID